jgi:uncharacterized protein
VDPATHGTTHVVLLADTHLGPGQANRLLDRIDDVLDPVDVIVHAGDVTDGSVLDALHARAPHARVVAVRGNNDLRLALPDDVRTEVDGCVVGVVHDSGPSKGRSARLRRKFPRCGLVVFGHSHRPWHEVDVAADGHVQHHVNPGSAIQRRQAPACTIARVAICDGVVAEVRHMEVGY